MIFQKNRLSVTILMKDIALFVIFEKQHNLKLSSAVNCRWVLVSTSASSQGSNKLAHLLILVRVFAARIHKVWMYMQTLVKS